MNDRIEHLKFRYAVHIVIAFLFVLWVVKAVEIAAKTSFSSLGVLPRTIKGSLGIVTGPLIHGDVIHLLSNTLPILLLGIMLFYFYHRIAVRLFILIYLLTGIATWLVARDAYHIGASGIVYGIASFLFFSGIIRKSRQLMTISAIIIFLYGGMIYGVFPDAVEANVSWESHLMGGMVGIVLAFVFRNTELDLDQEDNEQEEDEDEDLGSMNHTGRSGSIELRYTYKSDRTNPGQ